jgi:hypothetical protein
MSDPRANKFDASVMLFTKRNCQPEWQDGCKLMSELPGLPEEEADERWLSVELARVYWDRVIKYWDEVMEQDRQNDVLRDMSLCFRLFKSRPGQSRDRIENKNRLEKLEALKDTILKRIVDALHRGTWLLKGYTTDDLDEERTVAADLVTFEALQNCWTGSNYMALSNETKLFCPWLVMAPAPQKPRTKRTKARRKYATLKQVEDAMLAECKAAQKNRTKPPNENDFPDLVNNRLKPLRCKTDQIRELWKKAVFAKYKLKPSKRFSEDFWDSPCFLQS